MTGCGAVILPLVASLNDVCLMVEDGVVGGGFPSNVNATYEPAVTDK